MAQNGSAIMSLQSASDDQCVGCATLSNYIAGLVRACKTNGVVGGSQAINETPGLMVRIDVDSTT